MVNMILHSKDFFLISELPKSHLLARNLFDINNGAKWGSHIMAQAGAYAGGGGGLGGRNVPLWKNNIFFLLLGCLSERLVM